jgi:hypothetical protein
MPGRPGMDGDGRPGEACQVRLKPDFPGDGEVGPQLLQPDGSVFELSPGADHQHRVGNDHLCAHLRYDQMSVAPGVSSSVTFTLPAGTPAGPGTLVASR